MVARRSDDPEPTVEASDGRLRVERTLDAPPRRVYEAFTDPDEFAEWYGPGSTTVTVEEFDVREDGPYSLRMESERGTYEVSGRFTEVVENERLVRTAASPSGGDTLVTATFDAVEDGTRVVLTQAGFEADEAAQNASQAWTGSLEALAGRL